MATYRQVYISFWQDSYILDLDPEGKLLFIYLLTNTKTTQCGIYELPMKVMQFETGLDKNTIEQYLQKFEADGKILYLKETSEVFMVNWLKYNNIDSPKVKACIRKELMQVKNKSLLIAFLKTAKQLGYSTEGLEDLADTVSIGRNNSEDTLSIEEKNSSDTLSIGYGYPICNSQIPYGEEKEKEEEEEKEKEKEINNISDEILSTDETVDTQPSQYTQLTQPTENIPDTNDNQNKLKPSDVVEMYNSICVSLPKVVTLSEKRRRQIRALLKKIRDRTEIETVFRKAEESDFLSGRSGKWNGCNFDWLINYNNFIKVLEGTYDNKKHEPDPFDYYEAAKDSPYGW